MSHVFISYSTKNSDYAQELAKALIEKGFDVWIDNARLRSGDNWWESIVVALRSCAAFVIVMTPEARMSKWVQREVTLADNWSKPTFPLLREGDNWEIYVLTQFRDVKQGTLPLNEFFDTLAEKAPRKSRGADVTAKAILDGTRDQDVKQAIADPPPKEDIFDIDAAIDAFYAAEAKTDWQAARDWLWRIRESHQCPPYFLLDEYERDVQMHLERVEAEERRKAWEAEAEKGYSHIRQRVGRDDPKRVRTMLSAFWHTYSSYDPDKLDLRFPDVLSVLPSPFEWCDIPAGDVTIEYGDFEGQKSGVYKYVIKDKKVFPVAAFSIAKYPITNAQYEVFVDAKDGYADARWWDYSYDAEKWRDVNAKPENRAFSGDDHPRANVTWYESVAFCRWLTARLGGATVGMHRRSPLQITLPTEQQWQRAAQGDDSCIYPWGNSWDCNRCNNSVKPCDSNSTTSVRQYEGKNKGDSCFEAVDMAGNVWEWTRTEWDARSSGEGNIIGNSARVLRGGSWLNFVTDDFRVDARSRSEPNNWDNDRGFRLVRS